MVDPVVFSVVSPFQATSSPDADGLYTVWQSVKLDDTVAGRERLTFRPMPPSHVPASYLKGSPGGNLCDGDNDGNNNVITHVENGGGTCRIDVPGRNPRLAYEVTLDWFNADGTKRETLGPEVASMDNKDMIRQEYVNHWGIPRADGQNHHGDVPIPTREEIKPIPDTPLDVYAGGRWSESEYGLMIEDQMFELSRQINAAFIARKRYYQTLGVSNFPDVKLNLNSGWRNPERNEWYSSAKTSRHLLGNALDLGFRDIDYNGAVERAALYKVLWEAAQGTQRGTTSLYIQLEDDGVNISSGLEKDLNNRLGRDADPENGIDDAFETADHLHIH